jgi:ABC-type uncharacterized transport system auxiliary subunit
MRLAPGPRRMASLWLALAALAVGCSPVLEKKPITKERYVWQVPAPEAFAGPRNGVLRVGVVRVSPPFQNRGFVLRSGDRYASDFYNEFAAPPGTLLRDELVQWLGAASRFAAVVRSSETTSDWVLETNLDSLFADVTDAAKPPEATFAFTVRLLDARASGTPIRFEKQYSATEAAADRAPRSIAEAWSRALARLLPELAADLDAATTRKPIP